MEIWRDAKGFEGFYEVSSLGRVRAKARVVKIKDFNRHLAGKVRAANGGNVLRAIQTGGLYYGYSFRRAVIE